MIPQFVWSFAYLFLFIKYSQGPHYMLATFWEGYNYGCHISALQKRSERDGKEMNRCHQWPCEVLGSSEDGVFEASKENQGRVKGLTSEEF